jgi:hypothetical protein
MEAETPGYRRVELAGTVLLALAALATAWSTYQATHWRGDQAVDTSKATAAHIASSEASTGARQLTQVDIATFTQWIDATVTGDTELAEFYRRRFRHEFRPAFDAWIATDPLVNSAAPLTPFAMPEYEVAQAEESTRLNRVAIARSAAAGDANQRADNYMLAVVLFAAALFFAGISTKIAAPRQREFLVGFGALILVGTAIWVATFPVAIGT